MNIYLTAFTQFSLNDLLPSPFDLEKLNLTVSVFSFFLHYAGIIQIPLWNHKGIAFDSIFFNILIRSTQFNDLYTCSTEKVQWGLRRCVGARGGSGVRAVDSGPQQNQQPNPAQGERTTCQPKAERHSPRLDGRRQENDTAMVLIKKRERENA